MRRNTPALYPEHPITIALHVTHEFENLGQAKRAALSSLAIPGSGTNVHAALDMLRYIAEGQLDWDGAWAWAIDVWEKDKTSKNYEEGREQAVTLAPELRTRLNTWLGREV